MPGQTFLYQSLQSVVAALRTAIGSVVAAPTINTLLRGTGSGTSAWQQLQAGDVAAGAIQAGNIAAGAVQAGNIAAGAIATADLAANAATKVSATTSLAGAATASTSQVALANISFTAPTGGEDVVLDFGATVRNGAINSTTTFQFKIDSGTPVSVAIPQQGPADAAYQHNASGRLVFAAVAAGAHTATLTWAVSGNTSTIDVGQFNVTEHRR